MNEYPTLEPEKSQRPIWVWWLAAGGCLLIVCTAVMLITGFIVFRADSNQIIAEPTAPVVKTDRPYKGITTNGNGMGDPNAPVKVIAYADFQCPYCQRFWQDTEPLIIDAYVKTGVVYYEYRSLGAFIGQESADAAEAAYCAGDQGMFWEYHDMLYGNPAGENMGAFSESLLVQLATSIGLDANTFKQCLTSNKNLALIDADVKSALQNNIQAAPSFLVNGQLIEGAKPFEFFQKAIDAAAQGQQP